ncbi:MAG TPA: RNA polymerase sigma factor [Blastocatellia bacterium]|nr:RNA polymerase sigma factor [Blastocatellia bacterium]
MEDATNQEREGWLVLRAQSGDREALDDLLKAVQGPLYRYVSRLAGEPDLARDILQEVFIIIYRKLRWLKDPELFRPWAYRIASREAFKRLKRERRWLEQVRDESVLDRLPAPRDLEGRDREGFMPEMVEHLPRFMASVSPASRAVLILHYFEEMPLSEIAVVLQIAPGTVKSRLAYGLESLRRAIRKEGLESDM